MRIHWHLLAAGLLLTGCGKKETAPTAATSASASAAPSVRPEPPPPATKSATVTFESQDNVPLKGDYFDAGPDAPLMVFIHRFRGNRAEWKPMADRMAASEKRYSIINFDMRGHGESVSSSGGDTLSWAAMKDGDSAKMLLDVLAAVDFGLEQSGGKAPGVVLVGTSYGGTLAALAASMIVKATAVAVVSPGAQLQGQSVYHAFADVRMLPSFLAAAKDDNVAMMPIDSLSQMGKDSATTKKYESGGHGAHRLFRGTTLMDDFEQWALSVYDEKPRDRQLRDRWTPEDDKKKRKPRKGKGK